MKIFVINKDKSLIIEKCGSVIIDIDPDQKPVVFCPAFASSCKYGDVCQIEDRPVRGVGHLSGSQWIYTPEAGPDFPDWCPLDKI